ncbi:MAG TPA: DUF1080 domain-containing protein [Terriglobia bacterium]|nr:DUF1080 domain-containing protein [Terriglobia bacterium]
MCAYSILCLILFSLSVLPAQAQSTAWKQLFNGKDMTGWEHVGPGGFTVEDGMLKPHGGMGLLWYTGQKFGDVVIRVVFKPVENSSNSGVFIRIPEKPTEPWMPVNRGYEVQIDNSDDEYHCTGVLYSLTKALARPEKPGEWNTMEIKLDGPHTVVTVNGVKVTDYTEGQPVPPKHKSYEPSRGRRPDEGYIGLQNHSDKDVVYFKEVAVQPLAAH